MTAREVYGLRRELRDKLSSLDSLASKLADETARAARGGAFVATTDWMRDPEYRRLEAEVADFETRLAAAEREIGGRVYRVPDYKVAELLLKVEKIAKRARKLGVGDVTITVAETEAVEMKSDSFLRLVREYAYVVLAGETPVLEGWEFLATLQHLGEGENLVRRVPTRDEAADAVDLTAYRTAAPVCDHCGYNRRRKDTYVVRYVATGDVKQVGSDCLKDFVGGNDPHRAAKYAEYLIALDEALGEDEDDDFGGAAGMTSQFTNVRSEDFLAHVALMVRLNGWTARSAAGWDTRATADLAEDNLWAMANDSRDRSGMKTYDEPSDEDVARANAALLWAREVLPEKEKPTEFDYNLLTVAKQAYMPKRGNGILAYVVVAHARALEHEIKLAERKKNSADSKHFGEVKKRYELTLTVEAIFENEGAYGTTWITKLRDADGSMFTWFGSYELDRGGVYTGKWTVKAHEEFRGELQTVITRPHGLTKVGESEGVAAERERVEKGAA